jgi:hypothetical protein
MYEVHKYFRPPENENQRIWRYLDFTKFVSLIDRRELFFVCAKKLEDPYEGLLSEATLAESQKIPEGSKIAFLKDQQGLQRLAKGRVYINSWYMNAYESAAMWKLYLKSDEGLAICSTFKRLKGCFGDDSSLKIHIGEVVYLDYATQTQYLGNIFRPFLTKRKSFEYEKELRAVISITDEKQQDELRESGKLSSDGVYVPIEISTLIEKIFVSPKAEDWFKDLVVSITRKYELHIDIERSDLAIKPLI